MKTMLAGFYSRFAGRKYAGMPAPAIALAAIFLTSVAFYWHGFGPAGDAERYVVAALTWAEAGPYLGDNHWSLRHLYVISIAAAYKVFGPGEFATALPNIFCSAGLVAATYVFGRRSLEDSEAFLAAVFVAVSAFLVARPMEIGVYGPEILFGALACWLVVEARRDNGRRLNFLAAAGLMSGLAWTIREQTIYLIASFGLLALVDRNRPIASSIALGAGFGAVILGEWLVYFLAAGDAFYRYNVDMQHRTVGWDATIDEQSPLFQKLIRPFKDAIDDPITTPLLFLAIGAGLWMGRKLVGDVAARRETFWVFGAVSILSAIVASYVFDFAKPRYFPVFHYTALLVLASAAVALARRYGNIAGAAFAAAVVFLNVAGENFSNYNEYADARRLAEIARSSAEPVYTDPMTASRARHYLQLFGASKSDASRLIHHSDPPVGALFFKAYSTGKLANPVWCVTLREKVRPYPWTHAFLRRSGIADLIGGKVAEIVIPPTPVEVSRVVVDRVDRDPATGAACLPAQKGSTMR